MKRTALIAGVSAAALLCALTSGAGAAPFTQPSNGGFGFFSRPFAPPSRPDDRPEKKSKPDSDAKAKPGKAAVAETDKTPPAPKGLLQIVVSLDKQRATLFADGVVVTQSKISSGTAEHPTPLGIFSILQKSRHHVSNLYDAPMPFMQRITWSGSALHEGPLPGYPASHGCVRLPNDFAQFLWKATKLGARVIITRDEPAPVAIAHELLVFAKANVEDIKTAPSVTPSPAPSLAPSPAPTSPVPTSRAPQPEPMVKANAVPKVEPKPDMLPERKTPPLRDSEPVMGRSAPLFKTADAAPVLRGAIPDTVKPLIAVPVRNAMAGEQPTKLPMSDDADDLAMPQAAAAATTGSTAVPARPVPAEAMAKADNVKPENVEAPRTQAQVQAQPEPAPVLPVSSPVVAPPPAPSAAPAVAAKEPPRRKGLVSMFISLKDQRLYVRQNMEPLFDTPVSIARTGEPIGTHVYTAMGPKTAGDGLRWTVVSIPSGYKPLKPEPKTADKGKKTHQDKPAAKTAEPTLIPAPLQNPRTALDRITIPQDAVERIATLITPGASLIVSDNKLSGETGTTTDFIVETK